MARDALDNALATRSSIRPPSSFAVAIGNTSPPTQEETAVLHVSSNRPGEDQLPQPSNRSLCVRCHTGSVATGRKLGLTFSFQRSNFRFNFCSKTTRCDPGNGITICFPTNSTEINKPIAPR